MLCILKELLSRAHAKGEEKKALKNKSKVRGDFWHDFR